MNLLELIEERRLLLQRTSSTRGGEYHSSCPNCGGADRFMFWPKIDRYWCRQCNVNGDAIQFCRDFLGLDYRSACIKTGVEPNTSFSNKTTRTPIFSPEKVNFPPELWQKKARETILESHFNLLNNPSGLKLLYDRGFSIETIKSFSLGWNPDNKFLSLPEWGLPQIIKENGQEKKLWLPKGILIPTVSETVVSSLKTRRSCWKEGDKLPKYVEISGSMKCPSFYGIPLDKPIVIIESELDAILTQQFANDVCCCLALGGAGKKPDLATHNILRTASILLFALDFDEAGKKAFQFWKSTYPKLRAWPVPIEKSPGDAHLAGIDLRKWIEAGITNSNKT